MSDILVGADPEVFLRDGSGIISAIGVLPGTKDSPFPTSCGGVQVDNVLGEFNITPAHNEDTFVNNVMRTMMELQSMLPEGMYFEVRASHEYSLDYLASVGPAAFAFGCDPDYNAYTGKKQVMHCPNKALRSAGGHIHIGSQLVTKNREAVVKAMDYLVGLPSVLREPDTKRRELYGKAGSYRPKPYGLEYRTPSNFWIKDEGSIRWAYRQTIRAANEFPRINEWGAILPLAELRRIIDESDTQAAEKYHAIYA